MRRLGLVAMVCGLALAVPSAHARQGSEERGQHSAEAPAKGEKPEMTGWKWANFAVLAGALGWLAKKNAGPYFAARSRKIQKDMIEADDFRQQAETRAATVERRLAGLEAEIASLRSESSHEAQAEGERLARQTATEIAKTQAHAEEQIAAAGKAIRMELKRYAAELAIGLAQQKIQARMTPETQDALVRGFVRHLETPVPPRSS